MSEGHRQRGSIRGASFAGLTVPGLERGPAFAASRQEFATHKQDWSERDSNTFDTASIDFSNPTRTSTVTAGLRSQESSRRQEESGPIVFLDPTGSRRVRQVRAGFS